MNIAMGVLLGCLFLYLNYKIIFSDIKNKTIPNYYLLGLIYLLPFWYIYTIYYGVFGDFNFISILVQISLAFIVSFALFHYGLWGAGDAKYLLVLWMFIPHMTIISMIGSIAFITLLYLCLYFIWFWTGRNIMHKNFQIYKSLWDSKKDEIINKKGSLGNKKYYKRLLYGICLFIIFFGSVRLIRVYIIEYIAEKIGFTPRELVEYILTSDMDILVLGIGFTILTIGFVLVSRVAYLKFQDKLGYNLQIGLLILICIGLSPFVYDEFIHNPEGLKNKIILIFTLYIGIYFFIKIMLTGYKIVFKSQEEVGIHINQLSAGMIVNKQHLMKNFGTQEILNNYFEEQSTAKSIILKIRNPISEEDCERIQQMYKAVKDHHTKKKTPGYLEMQGVRIMKVFALSPYIFIGFLLTFVDLSGKVSNALSNFLLRL